MPNTSNEPKKERRLSAGFTPFDGKHLSGKSDPTLSAQRKKEMEKYSYGGVEDVDEAYIDAFANDVNNYFGKANAEYEGIGYNNAHTTYKNNKTEIADLRKRGYYIQAYLRRNRGNIDPDTYKKYSNQLLEIDKALGEYNKAFTMADVTVSKFETEDDYNTAKNQYEWSQKYQGKSAADLQNIALGLDDGAEKKWVTGYAAYVDEEEKAAFDLEAGQAEIDAMEAKLAELRRQRNVGYATNNTPTGRTYGVSQQSNEDIEKQIRDLEAQIAAKKAYLNQAKRIQTARAGDAVAGNEDFSQYSGYSSTIIPDPAWGQPVAVDETYEWINNQNGYREQYEAEYERTHRIKADALPGYGAAQQTGYDVPVTESEYEKKGYDYLTEDEIAIYNYYYNKVGKDKAQQYLDSIQERLNQRKGAAIFKSMEGNTAQEIVFGIATGLDQFGTSMDSVFNFKDEYIPYSALQYTSGMIREDLADDGKQLPSWLGGGSLAQAAYDAVNTSANMAPSILAATVANAFVPGAGSWLGSALMGASAAGSAYQQALHEGYSKKEARIYSTLIGATELFMEKYLSGITEFGGNIAGKFLVRNMNAADNALKMIAKKVLGGMASEFTEEYLQEVIEPVIQNLVFNTNHDVELISPEAVYAGMLGALTAFGPESIGAGVTAVKYTIAGNDLVASGVTAKDLADVGSKFAADTVAYKLAGQIDENTNAFTMGRMFYEIGAQLTEQNVSAIAEALEQEGMPKKIARKNAEVMAYIVEGGRVSDFRMKMIEKNDVLAKVMREVIIDPNSTVYQRSVGYTDVLRKLAGETVEARSTGGSKANGDSEVSVSAQKESGSESRSEGGTGDRKASGIVSVKKGNPVVKLDDGSEVSLQDADLSPDDALIIKTVTDIDGISAQDAGDIFKILKAVDSDPASSSLGAMEAYRYGYYGFSEKHLADNANFSKKLTETQRNAIYEIGKKARDTSVAAETDSIKQKRSAAEGTKKEPAKLHITYDQGRGRVHDLQTGTIKGLNPKQKAAVAVAKVLQGLGVGTDFEFFSSYLSKTKKDENGNRVRVFLDANGNEVVAYAGVYRTGDGKIRIDLNAYNGKGLALNAMSHELVHFIKQWSPEKYRTMAELVSGAYEKTTMSMDQRVRREQNRLKGIRKTEVSYDEAYDEVVANALNRMLDDGTIVDRIAEIRKTDRGLADKMIECIRNFAKKLASIFANNESLFYDTYDLMQFKETVDEIRNLFAEALVEASDNRLSSIEAEAVKSLGENASVETNADGEMVLAKNESGNVLMYSEQTYQNGGREKLEAALKQNGHTAEEISETLSWVDDALDYIKVLAAGYAKNMGYTKLANHLLADIVTNVKTGKQVMSAIVNNGDYPVNIDLSLICKKRVAYMNLMSRLIRDGVFDKVNYDGAAIAEVNGILRENGFETACLGCFVESRRLQFQTWAETIVSEWNAEVEKRNPNAKFFGFAKGKMETLSDADINALTAELESVKKNDQGNVNLGQGNSVTRMGRLLDALPSLQMKLTVEDLLTPEGLTALRKHDGSLFSIVKSRYGAASPKIVQDFNPYASEIAMLTFAQVKGITNNAVKGAQAYITEVKREYGKPKKAKGESKAEFNKRKKDHEQRVQDEAMRRYLYDIGGARIQSFSDFMIENVFDYIQIFADLSAKRLPLHGYSKEIVCLRLFGMTGAKWNGSLIAHVERSMGKEYAGLLPAGTSDGIPVRVDGKDYVIGFDDYARNAATGGKSFIQSIGMKDIIALQLDPRYSPYVGNITIGVSDAQIMAMLDNPLFRMVIPYHASGMLPMFAKLVGVDMYNDYTDYQNTTVRQYYDLNGNAVTDLKNAKGEAVKADTSFAFNAEIQKTGDAKTAADNYLRWCAQRHPVYDGKTLVGYATFNPKFSSSPYGNDFTRHENYYKLLEDFNTYDSVTEESAVQGAVTMNFPSEENRLSPRQMEAYKKALRDTGIFTEKEIEKYARKADMTFKEIINAEVGNRANYEVTQAPKWEATVKAVEEKLQKDYAREQYSSQETDFDGDFDYSEEQYSTQETDNITARDLLTRTDVATVKNEVAKKKLTGYQKTLEVMTAEEQKLREIRAEIKNLSFAKGTKDTKKLKDLKSEAAKINNHLSVYEGQLQRMEKELQSVVKRERAKVVKEAEKRDKAVLAKEWMAAEVKQSETLRDLRETRAALREQKSDASIMEKEFIRIAKEYEKLNAKTTDKSARDRRTISELRAALREEAKKHRDDRKMWEAEFGRLMREYDAAGRNIDRLEQKIERQKAVAKERVESRSRTAVRHKIQNVVDELNRLLLTDSKKHRVPDSLKKAVAEALDLVNMDTIGAEERAAKYEALIAKELAKVNPDQDKIDAYTVSMENILRKGEKMGQKLNDLHAAYEKIQNSDDPDIANAYDPVIAGAISELAETIGNTSLKDMTIDQLNDVYDVYKMVLIRVRDANKALAENIAKSIEELAKSTISEVQAVGGAKKYRATVMDPVRKFDWNNMKPVYAMERIGSDTLIEVFNNVRAGEDTWARDVSEARAYYLDKVKKYGYDKWDFDKKYRFESASGIVFDLTLEQIMSLYAYSRREQAIDHLRLGGFVFDSNIETVKEKGKLVKYKVNTADAHQITPEIMADIVGKLSKDQIGFVEDMQDYLSTVMGAKGNEVTSKMYGVKLFKEKFYFPLKSAKQFMFEQNEVAGEVKIKNSGFTNKVVAKANNPVVLSNFMDVWAGHVNDMSMYHAFTLPLEDFNRVFNYNTPKKDGVEPVSVKGTIQNAYSPAAVQYIKQLITDLNGGARTDSTTGFINKMMGLFKKGSVFASLSVVVQQPSAVARAAALIDAKYFIGPKLDQKRHDALWEEVKKYAPVALIKEMGYFDTNMGKSTLDYITGREYSGFSEKMKALVTDSNYRDEVLSKAPALADEMAWCSIWEAVKRETKANHPGMDVKSDAFLKLAGARFTEVITKTQVYDSVLARSANMRSKDTGMKMATAFMAEPTTSINMIEDALFKAKRDGAAGKRYCRRAIGAVIASQILNSILVSFVYAARDDDEDETYLEKYLSSLTGNLLDGLNPATYIPFIKDIISIVQGYDVERSDMSVVSDLWKAWQNLGKDNVSIYRKVEGFVGSIAQIFGLPVKNIMRDARGIYNAIMTITGADKTTGAGIKYAIEEAWTGKNVPDKVQLYEARMAGDTEHAARVEARYDDAKSANAAVCAAIKDSFMAGEIDESTALKHMVLYAGMDADEAYWLIRSWDTEGDFSRYDAIYDAVLNDGDFNAAMKELTSHGYTEKEVLSQVKSQIGKWYRDGEITKQQATNMLRKYIGMDSEDVTAIVNKWSCKVVTGIAFEDIKDEFMDGNLTASKAIDMYVRYGGYTKEEARDTVAAWQFEREYGFAYDDRVDAYKKGIVSAAKLRKAMIDYGELTEEEADNNLRAYEWMKKNPSYDLSVTTVLQFTRPIENLGYSVEESGIKPDTFMRYTELRKECKGVDSNNDGTADRNSVKNQVLKVIDDLPITSKQKDTLYFLNGWSAKYLYSAPWHR